MAKRKIADDPEIINGVEPKGESDAEEESTSDDESNILDVDFEWFDPQPEYDFQGIKTLLRQLFDDDAQLFDLSALTDLILTQPLLGSTVKVEGNESDPYAFLTVLNVNEHREKSAFSTLINYVADRCRTNNNISQISQILDLATNRDKACVGLILTERLINVPAQVVPPMYRMLNEEISWALEEKEPYNFTHYLILSKTYREFASVLDENDEDDESRKHKKQKKSKKHSNEIFYFHPEDEVLQQYATNFGAFEYKNYISQSDSKRAFQELGIRPQGYMLLIEARNLEPAFQTMQAFVGQD